MGNPMIAGEDRGSNLLNFSAGLVAAPEIQA